MEARLKDESPDRKKRIDELHSFCLEIGFSNFNNSSEETIKQPNRGLKLNKETTSSDTRKN